MRTIEEARQHGQRDGAAYAAAMLAGSNPEVCAQIRAKILEVKSVAGKTIDSADQGQRAFAEREREYVAAFDRHAAPFAVTGGEVSN